MARDDVRVISKFDKTPRFCTESAQPILIRRPMLRIPRMHRAAVPHRQFYRQVFLDRGEIFQFVVVRPINDPETALPQHIPNRVPAQNRSLLQRIAPLVVAGIHCHSISHRESCPNRQPSRSKRSTLPPPASAKSALTPKTCASRSAVNASRGLPAALTRPPLSA